MNYYIDERGSLKATEHDKYQNIARSVWSSLFISGNGSTYILLLKPHRPGLSAIQYLHKLSEFDYYYLYNAKMCGK
jgi:hypothetical protein